MKYIEVNDIEVNDIEVNDILVNDIQVNNIQVNDIEVNDIQVNGIQVNDIQANDFFECRKSFLLSSNVFHSTEKKFLGYFTFTGNHYCWEGYIQLISSIICLVKIFSVFKASVLNWISTRRSIVLILPFQEVIPGQHNKT